MNRDERQLKAVEQHIAEESEAIKAVWKKADADDRETSDEERLEIEERLKTVDQLKEEREKLQKNLAVQERVNETAKSIGPARDHDAPRVVSEPQDRLMAMKSIGEQFVESDAFKRAQAGIKTGDGTSRFSTGLVPMNTKGTLLEGTAGSGAGLIPVPQVIPGVTTKLFQRLTVADLLPSGQTQTNSLRYVVEGTATSGAAGVAEAGLKPQSTLGLSTVDEPVKKIATVLKTSDEMMEDAAQVQSYINGRLSLFVVIEEERQLLHGAGTNELVGLLGRSGVNTYAGGTAVGSKAEQIFRAITGTRGSALLEPDFLVVNPTDWQDLRLLKDANNQYFGGGPFTSAYGGPQGPAGTGSQLAGAESLWMKPVVITTAIGAGTALLGTSSAAQVWRRGGVSVEATNSNEDDFLRNLVAIRAEERLALAVYRPSAFTKVVLS
jgi:HK97 family phage major capsid protein